MSITTATSITHIRQGSRQLLCGMIVVNRSPKRMLELRNMKPDEMDSKICGSDVPERWLKHSYTAGSRVRGEATDSRARGPRSKHTDS